MGGIGEYFREHRWQRRTITAGLAIVVGLSMALIAYPRIIDKLIIYRLGSDDLSARFEAVDRAMERASQEPRFLKALQRELHSENDLIFRSVVMVLANIGKLHDPERDPDITDRINMMVFKDWSDPPIGHDLIISSQVPVYSLLLDGRDNIYVRRGLAFVSAHRDAEVRSLAAMLAARLGDDESLAKLLADGDPQVAATAALAAGLAGRSELTDELAALLKADGDIETVSAAAYALALLAPREYSAAICKIMLETDDALLRDRLLHVARLLGDDQTRSAVAEVIDRSDWPSAAALMAAGELLLVEKASTIRAVAAGASGEDPPSDRQIIAAFDAAGEIGLNVTNEARAFCTTRWGPPHSLALMAAVSSIGDHPGSETIRTLRTAAVWSVTPATAPTTAPARVIRTPVPSAAAAVALWKLQDQAGYEFVRNAAGQEETLTGDYIAWHLAQSDPLRAFDLGLKMLPTPRPTRAPTNTGQSRVYNTNERSTGAMMLALSARTAEQKADALARIEARLAIEQNFYARGALQCARLILGSDNKETVRQLLATPEFPQRRALTALLATGDEYALEWLLFSPHWDADYISFTLINKAVREVLEVYRPDLPRVDVAADDDLRDWQIRILRCAYAVGR